MEDEASVKALVNDAAFKRGKELIKAKKLHEVEFVGEDCEKASAVCEGSGPGDSYYVSISIDPSDASKQPTYRCSCPAGRGMCKHVIALLLHRANHLHCLKNGASSSEIKGEEEEDLETLPTIEWVRNPVKVTPDPGARRALPAWMTAAAVEKPKKARASKKQKVEEEDGDEPQTSAGRKAPAARKAKSSKGKQKVDDAEEEVIDDEEPVKPAKKATARQTRNRGDDSDQGKDKPANKAADEAPGADAVKAAQRRSRKAESDEALPENTSGGVDMKGAFEAFCKRAPAPEVGKDQATKKSKRKLKKVVEDEEATDATLDELMCIAHQNLDHEDSPEAILTTNVEDKQYSPKPLAAGNVNGTSTQPAKKKAKLNDSMFALSGWKSKSAATAAENESGSSSSKAPTRESYEHERVSTVGRDEAGFAGSDRAQEEQTVSGAARLVSTDTLEDEMLGMLFGGYVPKKAPAPPQAMEANLQRPEPEVVPRPAIVPRDVMEAPARVAVEAPQSIEETRSIQPKPKKKSSLKDQIGMLLK
ncbi:hypothetical protein SELMODRAFT_415181 [Selaginella moellendorffii]|uniref:SWIM-type domain-containing protein n=1 Tax=Selaginella moellendorffii TaxID=88036 RepID=D8RVA4_SELML|nr:ABC transporter F family member 4 [Selaginella moellendorffii]EFJ23923.1 hypothetical protein SELMODRAFT_415181 [Selaginella moellendorffii]|eukprot:XP_002975138.1 ABC transporter F family member 4 [Selaginella moellendorffii]